MRNLSVSVLALVIFAGCASETSTSDTSSTQSAGTTDSEIVGGTADPGDPAVIALFAHKAGESQGDLCSSSLMR